MRIGKQHRRKCILLVSIAVLLMLISGCGKKEVKEPVEISFMHGWGGTLQTHKIMQEIYGDFAEKNSDIELKYMPYSDSSIAVEKANDMLAVGKKPDILSTNGLSYYVRNAVKCGQAMDLMPYIQEDPEWKSHIHPSVFSTWQTGGDKLYTIPDALEVSGYWYNESYLRQAGIVDDTGEVKVPRTWEGFLEMAKLLQQWIDETGQDVSVFALDNIQTTEFLFLARLAGEGKNGIQAAENPYVVLEKQVLDRTLQDIDAIKQYSADVDSIENARQSFFDGSSVIYFNGVWESDVLKESKIQKEMKYANYPTSDGKSLSYISASSGYVLAAQTDERKAEACIRFLKYMLSEEVQMKMAIETGQAPSNPAVDWGAVRKEYPMFGNAINTAYEADVQISTIQSIWTENKINIVNQYIGQKNWQIDKSEEMLEALNHQ